MIQLKTIIENNVKVGFSMACMQNKMAAIGISVLPNRRIYVVISRRGKRSLSRLKYNSCNRPAPQTYTDRAFYHEDLSYLCLRHLCW